MQVIKKEQVCEHAITLFDIDINDITAFKRGLANHKRGGSTLSGGDIKRIRALVRSGPAFFVEDVVGKYCETYSTLEEAELAYEKIKADIEYRRDEYERLIEGLDYFYTFRSSPLYVIGAIMKLKLQPLVFPPWPTVIRFETIEQYEEFLTLAKIRR